MEPKVISVANDFSRYPAGRYTTDGPFSGQAFRDEHLVPALKSHSSVVIDLEGARGYGSSFPEEAFGGVVRQGFDAEDVLKRLSFRSQDNSLIEEIQEYIRDQANMSKNGR